MKDCSPTAVSTLYSERRKYDRRRLAFRSLIIGSIVEGRRLSPRRIADFGNYYADSYEPKLFVVTISIFLLCCLDALFTLILLEKGAHELNIFMLSLLENGMRTFVNLKLGITAIALVFLFTHARRRVLGGMNVQHMLYVILGIYFSIILYELHMLSVSFN